MPPARGLVYCINRSTALALFARDKRRVYVLTHSAMRPSEQWDAIAGGMAYH